MSDLKTAGVGELATFVVRWNWADGSEAETVSFGSFDAAEAEARYLQGLGQTDAHVVARTPFGTADIGPNAVSVYGTPSELHQWAHRPGYRWPCSALADDDTDGFGVVFDASGVVEYIDETEELADNLGADEMNAWTSDVLRLALPESHPCHFVTVGQFDA